MPPFTGETEHQRFTIIRSGVLTSTSSRRHSAISGRPFPERTDCGVWTRSSSLTDPPMPQPAALWPSPRNVLRQRLTILVATSEYYQALTDSFTYPGGWKAELFFLM